MLQSLAMLFLNLAPAEPDTDTDVEIEVAPDEEVMLDPPYRVLIHNDDFTPYDFVIHVLQSVFNFSLLKAVAITQRAHVTGVAYIATYPLEQAKYLVGQAHGMARAEGYPLTFTIEPEE
ncbi:MAG: ATP-dependent Clp protease adaptor ClpS [Chloroflexi bacterium]|nr:ATP-dependent Clp protease adaptor ClpS [Chloroflexota bacterium]